MHFMNQNASTVFISLIFYILIINTAFGNDQGWSTYMEPEGKFQLKYPSTWITGDSFNETSEGGLQFYSDSHNKCQSSKIIEVGVGHRNEELVAPGMNLNTTLRLDSVLFIKKFKNELQNFSVLGQPNFNKYNLSGHPSLYFEFTYLESQVAKRGFFIASDINNSIYYVLFVPDEKSFNKMLPIGKEIVSSIRLRNI